MDSPCNHQDTEKVHHFQKLPHTIFLCPLITSTSGKHWFVFHCCRCDLLRISHRCNHTEYNLLRLTSLTQYDAIETHSNCCIMAQLLSLLSSVPLYGYTIVYLPVYPLIEISGFCWTVDHSIWILHRLKQILWTIMLQYIWYEKAHFHIWNV